MSNAELGQRELVSVSFRVPKHMKELVRRLILQDLHTSESEFFRDALREKIKRDAPDLYRDLFRGGSNDE